MTFFDDLKGSAAQALKKLGEKAGEAKEYTDYQIHKLGLKRAIGSEEGSIKAQYEAMGRRVMEMHRAGTISDDTLVTSCRQVESHEQRIEELNQKIARLEEEYGKDKDDGPEAPPDSGKDA